MLPGVLCDGVDAVKLKITHSHAHDHEHSHGHGDSHEPLPSDHEDSHSHELFLSSQVASHIVSIGPVFIAPAKESFAAIISRDQEKSRLRLSSIFRPPIV